MMVPSTHVHTEKIDLLRIYWKSMEVGYIHRNALCTGRMSSFPHARILDFDGI